MQKAKQLGQFFTPEGVARTLVRWALRQPKDRMLDPACGDGEFLSLHPYSVGIELDAEHALQARARSRASLVHQSDFFLWAERTHERFEACVGNPPFIRYQGFSGEIRKRALDLSAKVGANFSQLTSSWAPFIAGAASLLNPGGRLAFVVPAEIGHATYSLPLLQSLAGNFNRVHIIALQKKIFPTLSEDAWLLFTEGFGGKTDCIDLTIADSFQEWESPPRVNRRVLLKDLFKANGRLRRWILPEVVRHIYEELSSNREVRRVADLAEVGIGYVSGGNDFFHLRPSQAREMEIPDRYLRIAVRKGEYLPSSPRLTRSHVEAWIKKDQPVFLLYLKGAEQLPAKLRKYLRSDEAQMVKLNYKCRVRHPWYVVPGVIVPQGLLSYMTGKVSALVENSAGCVATNSLHTVNMKNRCGFQELQRGWSSSLSALSREVEGHSLGGGMLKLEPGEVQRVLMPLPSLRLTSDQASAIDEGIGLMRAWRHCA